MDLTITLSAAEEELLTHASLTKEEVLHSILAPLVVKASETRLQVLADTYRTLTPDLQAEAVQLLRTWIASKNL